LKVLVIGNGAREHAIAKKLYSDGAEIIAAMAKRNPGIASISKRVEIFDILNPDGYARFNGVDFAVIGPDPVLAAGITDVLESLGIPVVGPRKALARLEWSKSYAREVLTENGIPGNPEYKVARNVFEVKEFLKNHSDVAVKPDALTGGKGVKLTGEHLHSSAETEFYAQECIKKDGLVVLEEKLLGREFTLQAFVDGRRVEVMPMVRDYKRAFDGDQGPNTGSMGSFSCPDHLLPDLPPSTVRKGKSIMEQTINSIHKTVGDYRGFLYGGFMSTDKGVYLIEYNARLGDPEAINVLSLLDSSLVKLSQEIIEGKLSKPCFNNQASVCVYLVPEGYPENPVKDQPITIGKLTDSDAFYASVYDEDGVVKTTGSRAIALLSHGLSVAEARSRVYSNISQVQGRLFYRHDIGAGV